MIVSRYVSFEDLIFESGLGDVEMSRYQFDNGIEVNVFPEEKGQYHVVLSVYVWPEEPGMQSPVFLCRTTDEVTDLMKEVQELRRRHLRKLLSGRITFRAGAIVD